MSLILGEQIFEDDRLIEKVDNSEVIASLGEEKPGVIDDILNITMDEEPKRIKRKHDIEKQRRQSKERCVSKNKSKHNRDDKYESRRHKERMSSKDSKKHSTNRDREAARHRERERLVYIL